MVRPNAPRSARRGVPGPQAFEVLGRDECWRLLAETPLGRLAVTDAGGMPDVFPLNVLVHDGALYARSSEGSKLSDIASRPDVALEVDGEDDQFRWSVVARGVAARLDTDVDAATDAEIEASGVLRLPSVNPGGKPHVIRLTPVSVAGRRIRIGGAKPSARNSIDATGAGTDTDTGPVVASRRALPPQSIPHFAPPKK